MVVPAVLKADEWDYASFRGATGIVWTPKRILIRAGERVLRDRAGNTIRGRCGNRLSAEPRSPAALVLPAEMENETPEVAFIEPPSLLGNLIEPADALAPVLPPLPPFPPRVTPPLETTASPSEQTVQQPASQSGAAAQSGHVEEAPEPGTLHMLAGGFTALLLLWPKPALQSRPLRRKWLMDRVACRIRCSFSTKAKRTNPSPIGPNPMPGDTPTSAFSISSFENSSDPIPR